MTENEISLFTVIRGTGNRRWWSDSLRLRILVVHFLGAL